MNLSQRYPCSGVIKHGRTGLSPLQYPPLARRLPKIAYAVFLFLFFLSEPCRNDQRGMVPAAPGECKRFFNKAQNKLLTTYWQASKARSAPAADFAQIALELDGLDGGRGACVKSVQKWFNHADNRGPPAADSACASFEGVRRIKKKAQVLSTPAPTSESGGGFRNSRWPDKMHRLRSFQAQHGHLDVRKSSDKEPAEAMGAEDRGEKLPSLVGRQVVKAFPPHGNFKGRITELVKIVDLESKALEREGCRVLYEDGDMELVQVEEVLLHS